MIKPKETKYRSIKEILTEMCLRRPLTHGPSLIRPWDLKMVVWRGIHFFLKWNKNFLLFFENKIWGFMVKGIKLSTIVKTITQPGINLDSSIGKGIKERWSIRATLFHPKHVWISKLWTWCARFSTNLGQS